MTIIYLTEQIFHSDREEHSSICGRLLYNIALCAECYSETRVAENTENMLYYPGFDQYDNNVHCEWTFIAPDGYVYIIIYYQLLSLLLLLL